MKGLYSSVIANRRSRLELAARCGAPAKARCLIVALGLVLAARSQAQSNLNYSTTLQTGLNLIANQLDHGSNTLNEIMPAVPDHSVLYKYDNPSSNWLSAYYSAGMASWVPNTLTLNPGEGAFLQSPSNFTLTFTGTPHVPVLPVTIPTNAAYLLSRQTNDVGNYANIVGLPPAPGSAVYRWSNPDAAFLTYTNDGSTWFPSEPIADVGEAVWISPGGAYFTRLPQITCPTNKVVQCGSAWSFDPPIFANLCNGGGSLFVDTQTNGSGCSQIITRTWVVYDNCTNFFTCSQTVTISEIPPCVAFYTWSTLAGLAGNQGSADGSGNAARFLIPYGAAVDVTGNVYVADQYNNTIRKVTPGGVVTTLAGLAGTYGSTDGMGTAARFNWPSGVAVDGSGNVYVADQYNHTIRKITPDGEVTTLAGQAGYPGYSEGTGSVARFYYPEGVAADSAGNVYVGDSFNSSIRKITPDGVVTTLAGQAGTFGSMDGTGSDARFNYPFGVAVDFAGNVYVADSVNFTIRMVTPDGVVTTLAGLAGNSGSTDGTGSAARFYYPRYVAVDSVGNVYVTDMYNSTIRKVTPSAAVTTIGGLAGNTGSGDGTGSNARFYQPFGVAVDSAGNVYVADTGNDTIRKGVPAPCCVPPPPGMTLWLPLDETSGPTAANLVPGAPNGTWFNNPSVNTDGYVSNSLCFDGQSSYVGVPSYDGINFGTNNFSIDAWIRRNAGDPDGIRTIVDKRNGFDLPQGYCFYVNGGKLVFDLADFDIDTYTSTFAVPSDSLWHHVAVTVDRANPNGILFYMDGAVDPVPQNPVPRSGSVDSWAPLCIGSWAFAVFGVFNGCIDEVELFNRVLTPGEISSIYYTRSSGKCKGPCSTPAAISCPTNKTVACGAEWTFDPPAATPPFGCTNIGVIIQSTVTNGRCPTLITRTWAITDCCGGSNNCSQTVTVINTNHPVFLNCPTNIALGCNPTNVPDCDPNVRVVDDCASGPVYLLVSSHNTQDVKRYNAMTGAFIDTFASGGGLDRPRGLVIGPDGNLYVASSQSNEIKRYNGVTGAFIDNFVPAGSGGLSAPQDLVFGPDGNLYVCGWGNSAVKRYNGTTGAFIDTFASGGGLATPEGLVFGPDGNLYVTDFSNNDVMRFNGTTGAFMDVFASGGGLSNPYGLAFGPDGNLYVTGSISSDVNRYDGSTGAFIDTFNSVLAPIGLVFRPDGNLYIASFGSGDVKRFNAATGAFVDNFIPAGSGGLNGPTFLTFTPPAPPSVTCSKVDTTNGSAHTRTITYTAVDGCHNSNTCTQVITWTDPPAPAKVVVPNALANAAGPSQNVYPFDLADLSQDSMRYQQVYAASQFGAVPSGGAFITTIAFRRGANQSGFAPTTLPAIQVNLSTTAQAPDGLSTTFANNPGADDITVFNGPLTVSSADLGNPPAFDIVIPLTTPFFYNPADGNLLLDVRNSGGGRTVAFDAAQEFGDSVSRMYIPSTTFAFGSADTIGLVTQFAIEAPLLRLLCSNLTISCGDPFPTNPPAAVDNCCGNATVMLLGLTTNQSACSKVITRTWQASDTCGNTDTCSQTVTVVDTTPPALTCATNKTVACGTAWSFDAPTVSDACSGTNVTLTFTTATNALCPRIITRTWLATDACGNTNSCSQTVTVDPCPPQPFTLFNSGVDDNGTVLPDGAPDRHVGFRLLESGPGPNAFVVEPLPPGWLPNTATSKWISPTVNAQAGGFEENFFHTTFVLNCTNNVTITGRWAADDEGGLWFNDHLVTSFGSPDPSNASVWHEFSITSGFVLGQNNLDFYVFNVSPGPTGVRFEVTGTAACCCPTNKTVICGSAWTFDAPAGASACGGGNLTVSVLGDVTNGTCPKMITRSWLLTDPCGYTNTCSQTVSVTYTPPQSWTSAAPMPTARWAAADALLPSGRVLVVGGGVITAQFLTAAEIFDPALNQWVNGVPTLPQAHRLSAVRLVNGQVLVAGDDFPPTFTAYLYDEANSPGAWLSAGTPNSQHIQGTLTLLHSGNVLLAGGYCGGGCATYNTAEIYRPLPINTWTTTGSMAATRLGHTATLLPSGQVLVAGGAQRVPVIIRGSCELFDEGSAAWSPAASMNQLRIYHTATLLPNGKVLVVGGMMGPNDFINYTATTEIYDPALNTWTPAAPMSTPRALHTATLLPCGKVLIAGGQNVNGSVSSCEVYDYGTDSWTAGAPLSTARYRHTATLLPSGQVFVTGGETASSLGAGIASSEIYTSDCGVSSNKTVACGTAWSFDVPQVASPCSGLDPSPVVVSTVTNGQCPQVITRTWLFTNVCGFSSVYGQTVTLLDTNPPVLICGSNKTVVCGTAWSFDAPAASDACSGTNVTLVFATATNGLCPKVITRTWTATDPCGNSNTCSQTVTVVNTTPPAFTCAGNKTVECGSSWSFDPPTGVDPCCGGSLAVAMLNTVTNGSGCSNAITRAWQATDCCGNVASCTQTVTVIVSGPPITPVIVGVHYDATGMHIIIQTQPCYIYALECKNSLSDPTWNICQTATGNGTNWEFIDPPPLPTTRFYRIRLLCP